MTAKFSDNRRTFLKMAVLLGGTTVGLALAKKAATEPIRTQPLQKKQGQGYRVTEHIRMYYRAARI
jgi:hypothetical protein